MKDWWKFIVLAALGIGSLVFWAGAVSATGVEPKVSPHGEFEYFFNRNQSIIAALLTISAAAFVLMQIRQSREQHRANLAILLRHETDAVWAALHFANRTVKNFRGASRSELAGLFFPNEFEERCLPSESIRKRVTDHSGATVGMGFDPLISSLKDALQFTMDTPNWQLQRLPNRWDNIEAWTDTIVMRANMLQDLCRHQILQLKEIIGDAADHPHIEFHQD